MAERRRIGDFVGRDYKKWGCPYTLFNFNKLSNIWSWPTKSPHRSKKLRMSCVWGLDFSSSWALVVIAKNVFSPVQTVEICIPDETDQSCLHDAPVQMKPAQ